MVHRLHYESGDKLFLDFASTPVDVLNPVSDKVTSAQSFVAMPECANYKFMKAISQLKKHSLFGAQVRALNFFCAAHTVVAC